MIISIPYTSVDGDRKVTAKDESRGFDLLSSSGIIPNFLNGLTVSKITNTRNLSIATGGAIIYGHRMVSDAVETLTGIGASALPRIDIVAVESNENTDVRACRFVIVQGNAGSAPSPPELTQTSSVYQIALAQIYIPGGVADYNSAVLTDLRAYTQGRHTHDDKLSIGGHTVSRALVTDAAGNVATSLTTATEIARVSGVTSSVQGQIDGKAPSSHNHAIGNVTGLQSQLDGKAPASHNHVISNVTGLQTQIDGKAAASHNHVISNVTGLQAALSGKLNTPSLTASRALVADAAGNIAASPTTATEIARVSGVTSSVQGQLNAKENTLNADQKRKISISSSNPSGGSDGDIWIRV